MRHALGVLGVLAAGVLLAVSAAMNWRFGVSLGRTELDGQIYGAASAAADCMKALVPFFLFAAIKNRMWSQAAASALVWVVVTAYSLTSALGHAALNRLDTAGQRTATAEAYKDQRADLARAQEQLSWIPQHRPAQAVQADIDALKDEKTWSYTEQCSKVDGPKTRGFCQKFHALSAELASAKQTVALEARVADIKAKLATATAGHAVTSEGDPQAAVLAKLAALVAPSVKVEDVQTALTVFIALLLEVGSGFGMYIAFSQWRLYDRHTPTAPLMVPVSTAAAAVAAPKAVAIAKPRSGANDNKSVTEVKVATEVKAVASPAPQRLIAPETDVERFYKERIETQDGSSLTATSLYEDYCAWCEDQQKEPLALPTFGREFGELGVQKARIAGRVRYIGIALKSAEALEEDKKPPVFDEKAA
ncbi:hypothetical protein [Hyphomicrobium sp. NDB2Meth4]|uniref:hypothetical protein n=1 Tax=Hyphomicrobium sp. NDB2Meth4 TaxID=1892846 RepID=UPI00092FEF6E|nr:hypothetical protein [Hyphomicrobium sp. NDB2Meth4]